MRARLSCFVLLALLVPTRTHADGHNVDGSGGFSKGSGGSTLTGWYQTLTWTSPRPRSREMGWVLPDVSVQFRDDVTQIIVTGGPRWTHQIGDLRHKFHARALVGVAYNNEPRGSDRDPALGGGFAYEYVPGSVMSKTRGRLVSRGLGFRFQIDGFRRFRDDDSKTSFPDRKDSFMRASIGISYWFPAP